MGIAISKPNVELTLRDVARRLGTVPQVDSYFLLAARELLTFLRSGQLVAFAYYPSGILHRLPVPAEYWRSINNRRFRQIEVNDKPGRKGTYTIQAQHLYGEYLETLFARAEEKMIAFRDLRADLTRVSDKMDSHCEVLIEQSEWERFLNEKGYFEEPEEEGSPEDKPEGERRGRPPKNWQGMIPYFVAVLGGKTEFTEKHENLAEAIRNMALRDRLAQVPEATTLKPVVSRSLSLAKAEKKAP